MQLATSENRFTVRRIVTTQQGAWKWQRAFRLSTYTPVMGRRGWTWRSQDQSGKFARTKGTEDTFRSTPCGSLHNKPARAVVDNYGNLVFIA